MAHEMITAEIDAIAAQLEKNGNPVVAARLDSVSNTLDRFAASGKRRAIDNGDMVHNGPRDERPPGSEDTDEPEHQDAYEASNYHKVPIGKQSVSDAIGSDITSMLSDLDFAQATGGQEKHEIGGPAGREAP